MRKFREWLIVLLAGSDIALIINMELDGAGVRPGWSLYNSEPGAKKSVICPQSQAKGWRG